jgi:hypothetical protein
MALLSVAAQKPPAKSAADLEKIGPKVGERLPDFTLPDQNGATERAMAASLAGQNAGAPSASSAAPGADTPHLSVTTSVSDDRVAPGTRFSLLADVTPKPTMHVYAPGQKELISVTLILDPNDAFKAHAARFPPPEKYFFAPLQETQLVFSKPFRIVQDVTIALTPAMRERARAAGAALTIKGTLRYQACDDKVCYLPRNVPLTWTTSLRPLEQ